MTVPVGFTTTPNVMPNDQVDIQFRRTFLKEYVRESGFAPYMAEGGEGQLMPIHTVVETKKGGETCRIPLLVRLKNRGVAGNDTLVGKEEPLGKYTFHARVMLHRHGVATEEWDEHKSFVKIVDEVKPHLKLWATEQMRDNIIDGLRMVKSSTTNTVPDEVIGAPLANPDPGSSVVQKVTAPAATLNGWMDQNSDRTLFGQDGAPGVVVTNRVAGNFSASIANVVTNSGTSGFGSKAVRRLKYLAMHADPHIRPMRTGEQGREYFVCFTDSDTFDQAFYDADIKLVNTEARAREGGGMDKNPLFQDGDLLYRGVIIREIPELLAIPTGTYGNTKKIGFAHLCGAQALSWAIGSTPEFRNRLEDDYGQLKGVALREIRGCQKIQFYMGANTSGNQTAAARTIDQGSVTGFFALS